MLASAAKLKGSILKARADPGAFIEFVFRDPKGGRIKLQPFHREWLAILDKHQRVQIEAARSHGKTTIILGYVLWRIGRDPAIRIKFFAQSEEKARERLTVISDMITNNKLFKLVFPDVRPAPRGVWHKTAIQVDRASHGSKDPTMEASGIMGSVEGGRADLVVFDDICLAEGTPVVTMRGLIPVEQVEPGDWLRNHKGTWSRVGQTIKRKTDTLIGVKAAGHNDTFYMTPEHPVYCRQEKGCRSSGHYTAGKFIKATSLRASKTKLRQFLVHPAPTEPQNTVDWDELWTRVELPKGVKGQHAAAARDVQPLGMPEFWWLVGLWLAEGWTETQQLGTGRAYRTCFAVGGTETHLVDRLRSFTESVLNRKLNVNPYKDKNALRVSISDKALHNFMRQFRQQDGMKECPWWIYDLPLDCAGALLAGHWAGDGSLTDTVFRSCSVSHGLLTQLRALAARVGVTASIGAEVGHELGAHPSREMSMDRTFASKVLGRKDFKEQEYTWCKLVDGELLRPVREVEELHGDFTVYNLQMDIGPHSYESPGLVSHNCDFRTSIIYPQHREAIKKKIYAEIMPMLEESGQAISIATPHHEMDAVASLRKNVEWKSYVFAVGAPDDPYLPLWPGRWPRKALIKLRNEIGALEYDRAYRCVAVSSAVSIIQPEHIQFYTADMMPDPWQLICVQSYDLAGTTKKKSSYFAAVTMLYDPEDNIIFVADAWHAKLSFADQAQVIVREAAKWQPDRIVIEQTGYQSALREYLLELAEEPLPIYPMTPGSKSKELRLTETLPMFEGGRIYFNPNLDAGTNPDRMIKGDIIGQLLDFAQAADQDLGDAFAYAVKTLRDFRDMGDDDEWAGGEGVSTRVSILG